MKLHKSKDITNALLKKGFKNSVSGDGHYRFTFWYQDRATQIHTKLSMGSSDPGRDNLQKMKRQLYFDNYQEFSDLVDCTFSEQQYITMLRQKGLL